MMEKRGEIFDVRILLCAGQQSFGVRREGVVAAFFKRALKSVLAIDRIERFEFFVVFAVYSRKGEIFKVAGDEEFGRALADVVVGAENDAVGAVVVLIVTVDYYGGDSAVKPFSESLNDAVAAGYYSVGLERVQDLFGILFGRGP